MAVRVYETSPPGIVAAFVLQACRQQLSHVRCLKLLVEDGWDECMWRVLGRLSQLTRLELEIVGYEVALQAQRLTALSSLVQLQHLAVDVMEFNGPGSCGYLASLSRLTHLSVPLVSADGLAGALRAGLGRLQHLEFALRGEQACYDVDTCVALSELPELKSLHLWSDPSADGAGAAELHAALPRMQHLQSLAVGVASPDLLSVLAGMPRVSALQASWRQPELVAGALAPALAVCSGLRAVELESNLTNVPGSSSPSGPWQAFPTVVDITQRDAWSRHFCKHC